MPPALGTAALLALAVVGASADQVCSGTTAMACSAEQGCLWEPAWEGAGYCAMDPCPYMATKDLCLGHTEIAANCAETEYDFERCMLDVCDYHPSNGKCETKKCLHQTEAACKSDAANSCAWKWAGAEAEYEAMVPAKRVMYCQVDACTATMSESACVTQRGCAWSGTECAPEGCTAHIEEAACTGSVGCEWTTEESPSCVLDACSQTVRTATHSVEEVCNDNPKCMYFSNRCMKKVCQKKYPSKTDLCPCKKDSDCGWDPEKKICTESAFTDCPDLDLVVLMDGSGSMHRSFGMHPHGFYGLLSIMREWVQSVPLTGDDHTKGHNAPPHGLRITFIQFSIAAISPEWDHSLGCAIGSCTNGLLSGMESELDGELKWAEAHYQGGWTYLNTALKDAADNAFEESPSWRSKVVMIFADGGLTDYDGDSCKPDSCGNAAAIDRKYRPTYLADLNYAEEKLRKENVKVFGIVLRRFEMHTFEDENAEVKLKPLVSVPQDDHFVNLPMDELRHTVLVALCDRTTKFGKLVARPHAELCETLPDNKCHQALKCHWASESLGCAEDQLCFPVCSQQLCTDMPECRWEEGDAACYRNPVTPVPPTVAPPTAAPPTPAPTTEWPPTQAPPTPLPTQVPPTIAPTDAPPTLVPTPVPVIDECVEFGHICINASQVCFDKQQTVNETWSCHCQSPSTGSEMGGVAECLTNECSVNGSFCGEVGQVCNDPDWRSEGDWECKCRTPQIGDPVTMDHATCVDPPPDDCVAGRDVCAAGGQQCDPGLNGADEYDNIFHCVCPSPSVGAPVEGGLGSCVLDECTADCWHCARDCADQTCVDPKKTVTDIKDWTCTCVAPKVGFAKAARAVCNVNECTAVCNTCANTGAGNVCQLSGQACVEKSHDEDSDWSCVCKDPLIGEAVARVSACREDECRSYGQICVQAGQSCHDPTGSSGDWECRCNYPYIGTGVAKAAQCTVDECLKDIPKRICSGAAQDCFDPDHAQLDTWECRCHPPSHGTEYGTAVLECGLDECIEVCESCADTGKGNACTNKKQLCDDPVKLTRSLDDWQCRCEEGPQFQVGEAVAKCIPGYDECTQPSTAIIECHHQPRYTDEGCLCKCGWELESNDCGYPGCPGSTGPGSVGMPCDSGCCNPDKDIADWCFIADTPYNRNKPGCNPDTDVKFGYCIAKGAIPASGGVVLRPPIPGVPDAQNNLCTDVLQECVDPDRWNREDWLCQCVYPKSGPNGTQAPAVCQRDECVEKSAVCSVMDHECYDVNIADDKLQDWGCRCKDGSNFKTGTTTECPLNECTMNCTTCAGTTPGSNLCKEVGQDCHDPNPTDASLGDWECRCAPPAQGTAVGSPAACSLNECTDQCDTCADKGSGNLCEDKGQICDDPNPSPSSRGDWECRCMPPSSASAVQATAVCDVDECDEPKCPTGQKCYDPDRQTSGDYRCECLLPEKGSKVGGPAVCDEDECRSRDAICRDVDQICYDPDRSTKGDWQCLCIPPAVGMPGITAPGDCINVGECVNNTVCSDKGQHCNDPDVTQPGDWVCQCIAPLKGTDALGQATTCEVDECTEVCSTCQTTAMGEVGTCELYDQVCVDNKRATLLDWECDCQSPQRGNAEAREAQCVLNECVEICPTCAGTACTDATQLCDDPDTGVTSLSDWQCKCQPPSATSATRSAVSTCDQDECRSVDAICRNVDQICYDPTPNTGDWMCQCTPPAVGTATNNAVQDCGTNECTAVCATCANTGAGNVCTNKSQDCVDPNLAVVEDWYCKCKVGEGTKARAAVPVCDLDECTTTCGTCAMTPQGNLCEMRDQLCEDPVTDESSLSDWRCRCGAPIAGRFAVADSADCRINECTDVINGKVPGTLCTEAGQVCFDPDQEILDNFRCSCPPPTQGSRTMAVASPCTYDECKNNGDKNNVCRQNGQVCFDPDTTKAGDWVCNCVSPKTGQGYQAAAVCEEDECIEKSVICGAAQPPQQCVDTNRLTNSSWECQCQLPLTGSAPEGAATCELDECRVDCATCAKDTCTNAGQDCVDENTSPSSTADWKCVCVLPAEGSAVANSATCRVDECKQDGPKKTCEDAGQVCVDDPDKQTNHDWECVCVQPLDGRAYGTPATCKKDECKDYSSICSDKGQICLDRNPSPASLMDWECFCAGTKESKVAGAATCTPVGECTNPAVEDVCKTAGQLCVDHNVTTPGDWQCVCVAPSRGLPVRGSAADCVLDECTEDCSTCAGDTCTNANQECVDTNTHPVTGLNTWECKCIAPKTGTASRAAAVCHEDECLHEGTACTAVSQDCQDPDQTVKGDWKCQCRSPALGVATGRPASCVADECLQHQPTCTAAGQECFDPNVSPASLGDWECHCSDPWAGASRAAQATCEADECKSYSNICASGGQQCKDTDPLSLGTWACFCPPPNDHIMSLAGPAECEVDECVVHTDLSAVRAPGDQNECDKNGQECIDPDQSPGADGDWMCICKPPASNTAVAAVATCGVDECVDNAAQCAANQDCFDQDLHTSGDWLCVCKMPSVGQAVAGPATCEEDECRSKSDICRPGEQVCNDRSFVMFQDWFCECVADRSNSELMAEATCTPPPGSECLEEDKNKVCSDKKQACFDPDPTTTGDWQCVCPPPGAGQPSTAAPASCTLDECAMTCPTCAGKICSDRNQDCVDPNTDAGSLSDWECVCKAPASGRATAAVAECVIDECAEACPTCAGTKCSEKGQDCVDVNPDARSTNDWMCTCKEPAKGNATAGPATCTRDECKEHPGVCGAGQTCSDPNKTAASTGDWQCVCQLPAIGAAVASPAKCALDECLNQTNADVCTGAQQECKDPAPTVDQRGDWECRCIEGSQKAVASAVPACEVDECAEKCNTCADRGTGNVCVKEGQTCHDPNTSPSSRSDWTCTCTPPATVSAIAKAATCPHDECEDKSNICSNEGQECVDRNPFVPLDWECECVFPKKGAPKIGGAASCTLDECEDAGKICATQEQLCWDPSPALNDWVCECFDSVAPAGQQQLATCNPEGECVVHGHVCSQAGQSCFDPNVTKAGDWVCKCLPPAKGVSKQAAPTVCLLDECTQVCDTCADKGFGSECAKHEQGCLEGSMSPTDRNDWKCVCPLGQTGSKIAGAATCQLDECLADKGTLESFCALNNQLCVDKNTDVVSVNDWECVCPEPMVGAATAAYATCTLNECLTPEKHDVCAAAGQDCHDENTNAAVKGDWYCVCNASSPLQGRQLNAPAVCRPPPGSWCDENEHICTANSQRCVDGGCECITPQTGPRGVGAAASCVLDECLAVCTSCADKGSGNLCTKNGQKCVEGSTNPTSTHDWRCECKEGDGSAQGAVASCLLNECDDNAPQCEQESQICVDPSPTPDSKGDWYCECSTPGKQRQVMGPASCEEDECNAHQSVCAPYEQGCWDPDHTVTGDWECYCNDESGVFRVGAPAECTPEGECATEEAMMLCQVNDQQCVDPTPVTGDWYCECVFPQMPPESMPMGAGSGDRPGVGPGVGPGPGLDLGGPRGDTGGGDIADREVPWARTGRQTRIAVCELDECAASCPTCARKVGSQTHDCLSYEQDCFDPNTDPGSLRDWQCMCRDPFHGTKNAATATCTSDECEDPANAAVCDQLDQHGFPAQQCVDENLETTGDWVCKCLSPYTGATGHAEQAHCILDECATNAGIGEGLETGDEACGKAGQDCHDPNQGVGEVNDWMCQCPHSPDVQVRGPATCEVEDLCVQHGSECGDGQRCEVIEGDWLCVCYEGFGESWNGPAECTLDECIDAPHPCLDAKQTCTDLNTSASSRNDWECSCTTGVGQSVGAPAVCEEDECESNTACSKHAQECVDPDTTVRGNWKCVCHKPSQGSAVGGRASCVLDECDIHSDVCKQAGQSCLDLSTALTSEGDWMCECPSGSLTTGLGLAAPANCTYRGGCDEPANKLVCTQAEQSCLSHPTNTTSFKCGCIAPAIGTPVDGAPAECVIDECTAICPSCSRQSAGDLGTCKNAGQECRDPDTSASSLNDWMCECAAPSTQSAVASAVEKCNVNDCETAGNGTAKTCDHFKRYTRSGCECACGWVSAGRGDGIPMSDIRPGGPTGPGLTEPCNTGCCNPDMQEAGEWCVIADTPFNRAKEVCLYNIDYTETCAARSSALPEGAVAPIYTDVCHEAGQECLDPNTAPTSRGDWLCKCPGTGTQAHRMPAACGMDECVSHHAICEDAGQMCVDPTETVDDWVCNCLSGTGQGQQMAAECVLPPGDECKDTVVCSGAGQLCVDPDPAVANDFECHCKGALSGSIGYQEAAKCVLDECNADCETCAGKGAANLCYKAGQICRDVSDAPSDWVCECSGDGKGSATMSVAVCALDECDIPSNKAVCEDAGQSCKDANTTDASLADWECHCKAPAAGKAVAVAAECKQDECEKPENYDTCHTVGQECVDKDTRAASTGDWECVCPPPAQGSRVAAAADCAFVGECAIHNKVCTDVGQTCVDLNVDVTGDWVCACVEPEVGQNAVNKPASCGRDECSHFCETCGRGICEEAGQDCFDPDLKKQGDWVCKCRFPFTGEATLQPATCTNADCLQISDEELCNTAGDCIFDAGKGKCGTPVDTTPNNTNTDAPDISSVETPVPNTTLPDSPEDGELNNGTGLSPADYNAAGMGDDDSNCLLCWLLPLILIPCLLAILGTGYYCKQRAQKTDAPGDKNNKRFQHEDEYFSDTDMLYGSHKLKNVDYIDQDTMAEMTQADVTSTSSVPRVGGQTPPSLTPPARGLTPASTNFEDII